MRLHTRTYLCTTRIGGGVSLPHACIAAMHCVLLTAGFSSLLDLDSEWFARLARGSIAEIWNVRGGA